MTTVALRHSQIVAVCDEGDAGLVAGMKWRVLRRRYKGKEWVYAVTEIAGKAVLMHRLIAGAAKGQHVDHINGDTLDNRRANLRICSHSDNMKNRMRSRFSASGMKGVHKYGSKWRAQIESDGVVHRLGIFSDPNDASAAYQAAAKKYHGAFAPLQPTGF